LTGINEPVQPPAAAESQTATQVSIGPRTWFIGVAVLVGAYILWLVVAGALSAFVLLFTGVLIANALRPFIDRLKTKMPFGLAVGAAFGAVVLVAVAIAAVVIAPLGTELQHLVQAIPGYVSGLRDQLVVVQRFAKNHQFSQQLAGTLANSAGMAVSTVGTHLVSGTALVVSLVANLGVIMLLAVGWALSAADLQTFTLGLLPPAARQDWKRALDATGVRLGAYVQGVVINGAVVGVAMGVSLMLLGVPYALLLGCIAAGLQAIPMVGAVISGPIILLVVLATSGWVKMLIVLAIFAVVQIVDQNVLSPIIFGQRVQLSFLLIIFSTVVGGALLGIPGAFLAVPVAAALQTLVEEIVAPAIRRANDA
jgi:predicted PurR-regulated permease PerM